jgi:hypothetical protein
MRSIWADPRPEGCTLAPEDLLPPFAGQDSEAPGDNPGRSPVLGRHTLFRYTNDSLYAGLTIQSDNWVFQLSLPLFQSRSFEPFSTNQAQIAHPIGYSESDKDWGIVYQAPFDGGLPPSALDAPL